MGKKVVGRRKAVRGGRRNQLRADFSDEELELVRFGAGEMGVGLAGFVAMSAVDAARKARDGGVVSGETILDWELRREAVLELMKLGTSLGRIGNNVNQVAHGMHVSGDVDWDRLYGLIDRIRDLGDEVDGAVDLVKERLG